jgi:hypothetical protein
VVEIEVETIGINPHRWRKFFIFATVKANKANGDGFRRLLVDPDGIT